MGIDERKAPVAVFILWSDAFYGRGVERDRAVFGGDDVDLFLDRGRAQAAADYKNARGLGGGVRDWRVVAYGKRRTNMRA